MVKPVDNAVLECIGLICLTYRQLLVVICLQSRSRQIINHCWVNLWKSEGFSLVADSIVAA